MRRWIRLIAWLYPARWRRRYGAEFDALLEDATPTWRNAVDVGWGALEMHMNTWHFPKRAVGFALTSAILAAALAILCRTNTFRRPSFACLGTHKAVSFFAIE
jgi:hypothetical protein